MSSITRVRPAMNGWSLLGLALILVHTFVLVTADSAAAVVWSVGMILFCMAFIVDWKLSPRKAADG